MNKLKIARASALALCAGLSVKGADAQQTAAPTVEARLGAFLENFWVDWGTSNRESRCFEEQSYPAQKKCLESKGYSFEVSSPKSCRLTVIEHVPITSPLPTTWDGKTSGKAVVARAV